MKNKTLGMVLLVSLSLSGACSRHKTVAQSDKNSNANSNGEARGAAPQEASNSQGPAAASASIAAEKTTSEPVLKGTYVVSEVQKDGVINVLTSRKTFLAFLPDNNYVRVSKENGTTYHSDSGKYRTEGDRLILSITLSQGRIFQPPREVQHIFSLERDGQELKLTSSKGNVALFRKTDERPN